MILAWIEWPYVGATLPRSESLTRDPKGQQTPRSRQHRNCETPACRHRTGICEYVLLLCLRRKRPSRGPSLNVRKLSETGPEIFIQKMAIRRASGALTSAD